MTYDLHWLTNRFDQGKTLKFLYFWGHTNKSAEEIGKSCFSQWYEAAFVVDGVEYRTAEHWMMIQKAWLFNDPKTAQKIIGSTSPKEAKELGRQVTGFDEVVWNARRYDLVKIGNIHKFNQHPALADYLLTSGDRVLVEASPVDKIWGIGLSQDSKAIDNVHSWRGLNLLGFALMEVRDFLREFGHFQPLTNALNPPWKAFPAIEPNDEFWRMGQGEDYVVEFGKYFDNLSPREQTIFRLTNVTPYEWRDFWG